MNRTPREVVFADAPLITPDRLLAEGAAVFAVQPAWAQEALRKELEGGAAAFCLDGPRPLPVRLSALNRALAYELTRFLGRLLANAAGADEDENYARLYYPPGPENSEPVNHVFARVFTQASAGENAKVRTWANSDLSLESYVLVRGASTRDNASEAIAHAEKVARRLEREGKLAAGFEIDDYVANLWALLDADPYEGQGVSFDANGGIIQDSSRLADAARFQWTGELATNLARGVVNIDPVTRESLKAGRLKLTDQFIDHHILSVLQGWCSAVEARMAVRRATRMARRG